MKILYVYCLCLSRDRTKAKELETQGYEVRKTKRSREYALEAEAYDLKLPFLVENGTARPLYE